MGGGSVVEVRSIQDRGGVFVLGARVFKEGEAKTRAFGVQAPPSHLANDLCV